MNLSSVMNSPPRGKGGSVSSLIYCKLDYLGFARVCRPFFRAHRAKIVPHSFPSPTMPLQEASPRPPAPRYHHPSKPRRALLENIEELFGMFAVLGALQASTQMLLAVAPSASMVMVTTHQQIVLNAFSSVFCTWYERRWACILSAEQAPTHHIAASRTKCTTPYEKAFSTICWCVVTITMLALGATARSI